MKKKTRKLAPPAEQVRKKVRALTGRKTYHSLDTAFGVVTVDDVPTNPRPSRNAKPRG